MSFLVIPQFYDDPSSDIHSENLQQLFYEKDQLEYLRGIYKGNVSKFFNMRDELLIRGISFEEKSRSNFFPDLQVQPDKIIYKTEDTKAFKKIDFVFLGLSNFIERFEVDSDYFFHNIPIEGFSILTNTPLNLLEKKFIDAGFTIVPVHDIREYKKRYQNDNLLEETLEDCDEMIEVFFGDSKYKSFVQYCMNNKIHHLSQLSREFVENYKHENYVGKKKMEAVMNLYLQHLGVQEKSEESLFENVEPISFFMKNSFRDLCEVLEVDYAQFINDFYTTMNEPDDVYPFEEAQEFLRIKLQEKHAEIQLEKIQTLKEQIVEHEYYSMFSNFELTVLFSGEQEKDVYVYELIQSPNVSRVELEKVQRLLESFTPINETLERLQKSLNDRELEVLKWRENDYTLEMVGEVLGVTRERVRQIERKAREKITAYVRRSNVLLYFHYAVRGKIGLAKEEFLAAVNIESELDAVLFSVLVALESELTYYEELGKYVLTKVFLELEERVKSFEFSPVMQVNEVMQHFSGKIEISLETLDFFMAKFAYKRNKKLYVYNSVRIMPKIQFLFQHVLKAPIEMDEEGFELIQSLMYEYFGEGFESGKRAAIARIRDTENVILVEGNTFVYHDPEQFDMSFINTLEGIIDDYLYQYSQVTARRIFDENCSLMERYHIKTHYHMYSLIQLYLGDEYQIGRGNTLTIYPLESAIKVSSEEILFNYVQRHNYCCERDQVLNDLHWPEYKLDQVISRAQTVMGISGRRVVTVNYFQFKENDLSEIDKLIEESLIKGYIFTADLFIDMQFDDDLNDLLNRNHIDNEYTLASVLKWREPELQGFSNLLYLKGSRLNSMEKIIAEEYPELIKRSEIQNFIVERGYSEQKCFGTINNLLEQGLFVQYDRMTFINVKALMFTDEVKNSLAIYLDNLFNEKMYMSMLEVIGYTSKVLPISCSFEWTPHLLYTYGTKVGYRQMPTTSDYRFDKLVLVKDELPVQMYDDFIYYVLRTEYKEALNEAEIVKYLANKKLCHASRQLPLEIKSSKYFEFDIFGNVELKEDERWQSQISP
ncbi:sigma factor-like helix-turn-helix DNA-binding protein [Bacillus cereus]|uniref:sigma factor-like helix-turn-helix DNA-binding protein n=1 Tax=Bacillus cereus TaxID=1396 RepID=UPI001C3F1601|nr:sigma factor-like helix-turn-helix DNA-binding protein [Bacillus cereus]